MIDETIIRKLVDRLVRTFADWLLNRTVEQHYSAEAIAKLLEVTERTVANYVELYETSGGKEGIGPKVVLSFKVVRYSASSVNRFIRSRVASVTTKAATQDQEHGAAGVRRELEVVL